MKAILATSLSVLFAAVALSSCQSVSDIDVVDANAFASSLHSAQVTGSIPGTRANDGSFKSEWTSEDWIYTYNNGKHSYFRANEAGTDASFSSSTNLEWADGVAYAAYPKSVKFTDGSYRMSFAGQTGLLEDVDRFALMTAKAYVTKGNANFAFESHASVLAIPAEELMYNGSSASKVVVSGENFSSVVNVSIVDGDIKVSAEGDSELVVNSPSMENGYIFVALVPAAGELNVDLYDNIGGHFFTSINGESLVAGSISDLSDANWDGGIEITFNPSVSNWD